MAGAEGPNPQQRFWRPTCYHYTMPLSGTITIIAVCGIFVKGKSILFSIFRKKLASVLSPDPSDTEGTPPDRTNNSQFVGLSQLLSKWQPISRENLLGAAAIPRSIDGVANGTPR